MVVYISDIFEHNPHCKHSSHQICPCNGDGPNTFPYILYMTLKTIFKNTPSPIKFF